MPDIKSSSEPTPKTELSKHRFNNHRFDPITRCIIASDRKEIRLRTKSTEVFEYLIRHANTLVRRDDLIRVVWKDRVVTDDSLNKCISDIRKAIDDRDRQTLETISGQGYLLRATTVIKDNTAQQSSSRTTAYRAVLLLSVLLFTTVAVSVFFDRSPDPGTRTVVVDKEDNPAIGGVNNDLVVSIEFLDDGVLPSYSDGLVKRLMASLSRYSGLNPKATAEGADYRVELSKAGAGNKSLLMEIYSVDDQLVLVKIVDVDVGGLASTSDYIAALIGSPAGGAIGRDLIKNSRSKPVEVLTRPECLAHGYGCTTCSGEFDTITPKAVQCLATLLEDDPNDADAWALQSTVYSRQYLWGSTLNEPMRSNLDKRLHLKHYAVQAATKAESLSDRNNPGVYWGMAQAYLASCDADKLYESVNRGLAINSNDPAFLGVFGNFTAFAGKWKEGVDLVKRALALDPEHAEKWWYFALGKDHYRRGEYEDAYRYFLKAFDERNWLSHLQLAYTLPYLGRHEEAKNALDSFNRVAPGFTLEHVVEFYRSYCFDDDYISRVRTALESIDMPSRENRYSMAAEAPVGASIATINNRKFEYIDVGEGTPLIFIHGAISDYRTWGYMMVPISEKQRFISYSLRHYGTQPWPDGDVDFDFIQDEKELIEFIEFLDIKPVVLVGWSRGVQPAVMVAKSRPDLVSKLVLYEGTITGLDSSNGPASIDSEETKKNVLKMENAMGDGDFQTAIGPFFEIALQYPPGTFDLQPTALQKVLFDNSRTLVQYSTEPTTPQPDFNCAYYKGVTTSALVIHGENTNPWWQYESENIADCMPAATLKVLTDATHDGPLSRPHALTEIIREYVVSDEI